MLNLLLLPFRVVRRFLWMIIWYSVYFLLKRPKLFILTAILLLFGIVYGGWEMVQNSVILRVKPDVTDMANVKAPVDQKTIPAVTGKIENGNSAFASNLLTNLNALELQTYSKEFYKTMASGPTGQEYRWQANKDVYGSITPEEPFKSGSGMTCRRFSELLSVRKINQKFNGISCQQSNGGWCKLRSTSVPVCGMKEGGSFDIWWHNKKLRMNNFFRW